MMTHFKATHEPFDYPERHNDLNKDASEPHNLYMNLTQRIRNNRSNCRKFNQRWLNDTSKNINRYPEFI